MQWRFVATVAEAFGEHGEQYVGNLTYAALEMGDLFSRAELAVAVASLGER